MPDFYIKGTKLTAGYTYAVGGGGTGYTSPIFPNGASALDAFNGFMVKGSGGANVGVVFSGSSEYIAGVSLSSGTVYPFRLRAIHIPAGGNDVIGLA